MKWHFRGDPEFRLDNFYELPFEYIVIAHHNAQKSWQHDLHAYERPIAQVSQLVYNTSISKKAKAISLEKLYMYQPADAQNTAATRFANAAQALIRLRKFPSWGLFCYKELTAQANNLTPPEVLCYQSEHAIILAPEVSGTTVSGLLIVLEAASGSVQDMESETGQRLLVEMPHIGTKIVAKDDVTLRIVH